MRTVLRRVPPLYLAARRAHAMARSLVGPIWLRRQVQRTVEAGRPLRVVIGSSQQVVAGWLPTNVEYLDLLDPEHWRRAFGDARADAFLAEHVWEHLTPAEGRRAAARCYSYLKPGGYLRIAVPDGNHPDAEYIAYVKPGGSGSGAEDHKTLYTAESLREMLTSVGFEVVPLEYYDAEGTFHKGAWSLDDGPIGRRSGIGDARTPGRPQSYTSLIVDATRPA